MDSSAKKADPLSLNSSWSRWHGSETVNLYHLIMMEGKYIQILFFCLSVLNAFRFLTGGVPVLGLHLILFLLKITVLINKPRATDS